MSLNSLIKAEITIHLDELRKRLLIAVGTYILLCLFFFVYSDHLLAILENAAPIGSKFFQLKPGELLMVSFKLSLYAAFLFTMPVAFKQIEKFLKPGLKENEQKILAPILTSSPIFFYLGLVFAYYLLLPPLLEFLLGFKEGLVEPYYGLEHYINLVLSILSICGISFQLPVLILTLGYMGLVTSIQLISIWRYVILGAFVLAALITPTPDPLTMSVLAIALLALYFATWLLLRAMNK